MSTRLARLETQKNFSVLSIEFLAVEKCNKQLDRRSFNDCRYAKPPAGSLCVSWESVIPVGSMAGLIINSQWVRGAGWGGPPVHPQRESCQLVGQRAWRHSTKSTRVLYPPPYQHCICNRLRFAKLYTRPYLSAWLGLFIVCWAITATGCDDWWVWDDSGLSVGSDKKRVHERDGRGTLCNLTPPQLPVHRCTSRGRRPTNIHALSASSTPSAALVLSTQRVSRFEILVSRNKILEN